MIFRSGLLFLLFLIFYNINRMTNSLCIQEIAEDRQPKVFRTINVLITILLLSSYIEIFCIRRDEQPMMIIICYIL